MFDARILLVRILQSVLVSLISGDFRGDLLSDHLPNLIGVFPVNVPELLIERFYDVAEPINFRFRHTPAATGRHWPDLRVLIGKCNANRRSDFGTVALHVDALQNAFREVLLFWCRKLWNQEV